MRRVIHILNRMSPGGVESLLMNLYHAIDRDKLQFDFYVNEKGVFDAQIEEMGGHVFYTDSVQKCGIVKYLRHWISFLKEHPEYDTIHCHLNNISGFILWGAKKQGVTTRIVHSHTSETIDNWFVKISKKFLNYLTTKNATILMGCSDKANQWLYGKHKDQAIVLNNGVDTNQFQFNEEVRAKIRKKHKVDKDTIVVGHVGRLVEVKNHKFLIDVFEKYHENNPNSQLFIIGEGDMKDKIISWIDSKNLRDSIQLLGTKTNINEYMQALDFMIFPSFYEGLPVTLIEAQASGLPVLASKNISEMSKVIETFQFEDLEESAEKWSQEIYKCEDRHRYAEIVRKAGFDIKDSASQYMKLLEII